MLVSDFDFELPEGLIAQVPTEPRDASRLLVYDRRERSEQKDHPDRPDHWVTHTVFRDLPQHLAPDDLLVLNNTKVLPHRLIGRRETGGRVEVLILERQGRRCRGYVKPARKVRPGDQVSLEDGRLLLVAGEPEDGGILNFELEARDGTELDVRLAEVGRAPLPPYIRRDGSEDPSTDRERYQTVFAEAPGAVAAPTAGLHFTKELLDEIRGAGTEVVEVTLHVGEGTFAPIRVDTVEAHRMHEEWCALSPDVAAAVTRTRERGGRVVAVGTTAARTLEAQGNPDRSVSAGTGTADIFLYPGRPLHVVDALLTNFHLPQSTLLMMVAAMTGREEILAVYEEAIAEGYRFFSYGDAMLVL